MHYSFNSKTTEQQFRRAILHEFGHALGLGHEHQYPTNTIKWNTKTVYAYYAKQGWSKTQVNEQLINRLSKSLYNYREYDKLSIMHYSIPKNHTTNGYSVAWNTVLSAKDKAFIKSQYPRGVVSIPEKNIGEVNAIKN